MRVEMSGFFGLRPDDGPAAALARALQVLDGHPRLRQVFETALTVLAAPSTAVAVGGSVARGEVDRFSDLDLVLLAADHAACSARRAAIRELLRERYDLIAVFDAAHLQLPCLDSMFIVVEGQIMKMDVAFWVVGDGPPPVGGVVVHDPMGLGRPAAEPADEVTRAPVDLPGWTCHVRKIIARGELFEASHCLDEMRRRFLVPVLLEISGLPQVNYRRIEARLPAPELVALTGTYPASLSPGQLLRALECLVEAFASAYSRLGPDRRSVSLADVTARLQLAISLPIG